MLFEEPGVLNSLRATLSRGHCVLIVANGFTGLSGDTGVLAYAVIAARDRITEIVLTHWVFVAHEIPPLFRGIPPIAKNQSD